ncbi:MAG: hypothetical protein US71_C0008G0012 [Parcubacteria group bacterium GW2011_GWD2_38_12]|uniref:Rubrerythrin diiron-binding domain-containing protein n=1 Tax=Candidatus Azambacteria bacterium RIFCSPLOWO2_01_FULL_37_9 TaxID=1797297 RepID=A0A1F5C7I0_9BACT|nr:MAG: hypothetical protein US06_C0014G0005 [Parcubacteria group bacterium GW2011_GWC2_36_17]KKQ39305.1 MAG: hypothetical protein US56_C0020G0005 [Candidatus Moranbacteria bacterium GW2011_GWF2_37_7]KKQ43841.1 MAG: hypothetical protein US61_C0002G0006 [Parcubacteria group bacterium GW2011_GWE2_37_8]KKQ51739.1 MAG: hypothetical protein US71_C0008G0012 [Parcubacteria group bacterium GW2011_GWD2_38_12]KKQ58184.1 MAG: hypothetical protein US78_C0021G0006 [Parcubacteria group bacterium GW2011_GWD1_
MKNHNYDLTKMFFAALDDSWRLEKYYIKDAESCSHCAEVFKKMKEDIDGHIEMLRGEIIKHAKEDSFD